MSAKSTTRPRPEAGDDPFRARPQGMTADKAEPVPPAEKRPFRLLSREGLLAPDATGPSSSCYMNEQYASTVARRRPTYPVAIGSCPRLHESRGRKQWFDVQSASQSNSAFWSAPDRPPATTAEQRGSKTGATKGRFGLRRLATASLRTRPHPEVPLPLRDGGSAGGPFDLL